MSRHGRSGAGGRKRKPQAVTPKGSRDAGKPSKKVKRTNDMFYEAMDSDPDEEKHADRYDEVENYEYELPSDFEDEEIDEEMAFTAEDKKLYAGWFGEEQPEASADGDQQGQGSSDDDDDERSGGQQRRRSKRSQLGEFADLESSSDDEQEGEDDEGEVVFGDADDGCDDEGLRVGGADSDNDMAAAAAAAAAAGSSDDDEGAAAAAAAGGSSSDGVDTSDSSGEDEDEDDEGLDDDERHGAMLAAVLGRRQQPGHEAAAAAAGKRRGVGAAARNAAVVAEAYPESEAHAGMAADGGGDGELRLSDLMAATTAAAGGGSSGAGAAAAASSLRAARKLLERLERQSGPLPVPLPRTVAERVERKAGYEDTRQEVTKWQPIVKANREAPTVRFTAARNEVSAAAASTSALVDGFTPNTDDPDGLEAQVAALLGAAGSLSAHAMAEAEEALAPKKFTAEEAADRAARLSKMRHLLFYAELKAKRLSKIKSKEYHRRANKAARRAAARAGDAAGDEEEEARLAAEEAEFDRAKERLTLKHRNSSKWARRALKRGQAALDPTTREALAAQLALGQQLRKRVEGRRGDSDQEGDSDDDSTSASDAEAHGDGGVNRPGGLVSSRSRKEALAILKGLTDPTAAGGDGAPLAGAAGGPDGTAAPKKGLFALPFMVRALEKQRAAAAAQAAAMLSDLGAGGDDGAAAEGAAAAAGGLDDFEAAAGVAADAAATGRLQFTGTGPVAPSRLGGAGADSDDGSVSGSDSEEDVEAKAKRLRRHLAGEAAAAEGEAAALDAAADAAAATAAKTATSQQQHRQQQQPQQRGPDVGYVEVALPTTAAAGPSSKKAAQAATAAANSTAPTANGVSNAAHAGLFASQQRKRGRKGEQHAAAAAGDGGVDAQSPSTSQPAGFIAAKVWQGPKQGYVFKRDKQGLGYYLDGAQPQAAAAGGRKGKGSKKQQQQQAASVQQLLQRQQQDAGGSSSDEEGGGTPGAAAGAGRQQAAGGPKGGAAAANGSPAAAAAVGAMQLLSGDADVNRQLLQAAFAGDDVEAAFAAEKAAEVEAELPSADVGGQLPGWGTWSNQQKEPAWMVAAKAKAAAQRTSAAAARQDSKLKHVVITEKWDKKAAKYLAPSLPFPYNDKQVYENAMRQPLGRQYNPDAAFRNLTRPAVLKTTGVVIEPARFSKAVEQYNAAGTGKGRAVVTIAGGMQLEGQAAGTGAGGVGKGQGKKKKQQQQAGKDSGSRKSKRLHEV